MREFPTNKLSCERSSYQEILEVVKRKFPEEAEEVLVSHGEHSEPWFFHGNKDAHPSQTALSVATHTRTPITNALLEVHFIFQTSAIMDGITG